MNKILVAAIVLFFVSISSWSANHSKEIKNLYGASNFLELYFSQKANFSSPWELNEKIGKDLRKRLYNDKGQLKESVDIHLRDYLGHSIVSIAAFIGDFELVKNLIELGADNEDLKNSLGVAVLYPTNSSSEQIDDYKKITQLLIDQKVDINASNSTLYLPSPLIRALSFGRFETAKVLMGNGAELNPEKSELPGLSPFALAIASCDQNLLEWMWKKGARFSSKLDFSIGWGQTEKAPKEEILRALEKCVDPKLQNYVQKKIDKMELGISLEAEIKKKKASDIIEENNYQVKRDLDIYNKYLHCQDNLKALEEGDHVIDSGSGESYAMTDLAKSNPKANITSITYVSNRDPLKDLTDKQKHHFQLLKDRFFEDIPDQEILAQFGKAKTILEFWGILAYSEHPDQILERFAKLLRDDGKIFLMTGSKFLDDLHTKRSCYIGWFARKESSSHRSCVRKTDGRIVTLPDWIDQIPGLITENIEDTKVISIQNRDQIKIPKLRKVKTIDRSMLPYGYLFEEIE